MKGLVALFFFQIFFFGNAQEGNSLRQKALEHLLYNRAEDAYQLVNSKSKSEEEKVLKWHIDAFRNGVQDSLYTKPLDSLNDFRKVMELLKEGQIYDENHVGKDSLIFQNYKQALEVIRYSNDRILTKFVLKKLLKFTFGNRESFALLDNYVSIYNNYIENQDDQAIYDYYKYSSISYQTNSPYIEEYETALLALKDSKNYLLRGRFNQMLGVQESYFNKNDELGINYFEEAARMYEKVPGATGERSLFGIYNNIGVAYSRKNKTGIALNYFRKALKQNLPKNSLLEKSYLYLAMAEVYKDIGNLDSTYHYLNREKEALKAFNEFENALKIQDIEIKYQTAEKEKQILEQQQKARLTRNWLIAAAMALLLGSIVAILLQKNTTKKRKLAEQEALIEQQKVETLLKEQELVSLDAMIAGQEKERAKVANELHDDLGSLMATVKLHFDNVKVDEKDPAMKNAQNLLEKAYQKIRGMAHAKNSGVMANQGLLPAVKKMAKTISETNALEVNVEDFGLADRMENSLELTLFRVLQELVANIIKHAEASKATIQFTQHEDKLNIIVEDDGKGFDMSAVKRSSSGMGLGTIEKRIEHLEGSFTVDSVLGKGTSILIDIPV